ncbi:MAG: polymerase [Clostridia bacterium]|jgi:RNA polymerase sigma-70 factor (ECF subfamily)|nr:polymerase [Clostridia bacterium]
MDAIEEIVGQIQKGDMEKYELLIEKFQKPLFTYVYHIIGDLHEAEDITQEALLKAYNNIGSYKNSISFGAWLYKIAYNHTINVMRRKKLISIIPGLEFFDIKEPSTSDENIYLNEFSCDMEKALSGLSLKEKSLLFLRILEERSYDEISLILNNKPENLRKKFERAKRKLRKYYEVDGRRDEYEQFSN